MFVSAVAEILHADLDAFYASVEQRDDPRLRGKPVIVGGGVVLAASYEAKARGVKTAMGGRQWRRLCPDAIVVSPRMSAYSEASKAVFEIFRDTTPLVEGLSIDEAFLDVRGLRRIAGTPEEIAVRLRARVLDEVGLPITVGVARTKFLAKVASGVAKPDGLLVVPPDGELDFLHPLPVERLWGVGPKTAAKLHARGIHTVGEVAQLAEATLVTLLGRASGRQLHALSHNRDPRRVDTRRRRRSIGSQRALGRGARTPAELEVDARRPGRPARPAAARRAARLPHGDAAAAVRRLRARDALAHAARGDGADGGDPGRGARAARRGAPAHPPPRHHADRAHAREPHGRSRGPARAARRAAARPPAPEAGAAARARPAAAAAAPLAAAPPRGAAPPRDPGGRRGRDTDAWIETWVDAGSPVAGRPQDDADLDAPPAASLDATLDELRDRFGSTAVTRAVLLGRDQGISVPLLPD